MLVAKTARTLATTQHAHQSVDLQVRELSQTMVLIAVSGEVDASTESDLLEGVIGNLRHYRQLVLDLAHVRFFGTAGYAVLHRLNSRCARSGIDWVLVEGPEVQRLLRFSDPDRIFPAASNIVSAVATLARGPHRTPQLRSVRTN